MTASDDIPVLDVVREQLVAGIRERGSRRRRLAAAPALGIVVAVAVVAAVLLAAQTGGHSRQVIVHGPPAGRPGPSDIGASNPTTTVTAPTVSVAPMTTTSTPRSPSPTAISNPPPTSATTRPSTGTTLPGSISLTVADRNRSLTVAKGTVIDVNLDGDSAAIWPTEPHSTDGGVLQHLNGSSSPTSSHAQFVALASGTAQLADTGGRPCPAPPPTGPPQGCVTIGILWAVNVTVN